MAKRNEEVFEKLANWVKKNPNADVDSAVKVAQKVDPSIDPDDKRSFNAQYLLPAKRKAGVIGGKKKARKKAAPKKKTQVARELILERDRKILELAKGDLDAREAYGLAASVDEFLDELRRAL